MSGKKVALRISGLSKEFRPVSKRLFSRTQASSTSIKALSNVNFELHKGEILGILGPNGAGKTTLLKIISRITTPTSGTIEYEGKLNSIIDIGTGFHPDLSGRENIALVSKTIDIGTHLTESHMNAIIGFSGLHDSIDEPVRNYSSGMYLRLAFSISMHMNLDILLLDEVLAVGDEEFRRKCSEKIRSLAASGVSIILVTHNLDQLLEYASRVILLVKGKVEAIGQPVEIIEGYLESITLQQESNPIKEGALNESKKPFKLLYDLSTLSLNHFKLKEVSLNSGKDEVAFTMSSEITISLTLDKTSDEGTIAVGWHLKNMNDQRLFLDSFAFRPDYKETTYKKGQYCIKCIIPKHLLNRGVYTLSLIISNNSKKDYKEIPDLVRFKINQDRNDLTETAVSTIIKPRLDWEIKYEV